MKMKLVNKGDTPANFAKTSSAGGLPRPGVLAPGEELECHAVTFNVYLGVVVAVRYDEKHVFNLSPQLVHEISP